MANDTCPHCGAGRTADENFVAWTCGSMKWGPRVRMSDHCETRQDLAAVTAERDALARRIAEAPVGYVVQSLTDEFPWTVLKSQPSVLNGLTRVRLFRDDADKSP